VLDGEELSGCPTQAAFAWVGQFRTFKYPIHGSATWRDLDIKIFVPEGVDRPPRSIEAS